MTGHQPTKGGIALQNNMTTIAALSTPPGKGGIAIVRLSGPNAKPLLETLFRPSSLAGAWESHRLMHGHAYDGDTLLDECMAVLMLAPRSYTKEDVAELHLHGGDFVATSVLKALYRHGAVPAEPGEFTRRAFLNGRMDLSRAEAVMSLISAQGAQAARAALRQLEGGAFSFIHGIQQTLLDILSAVTAALDYPDEYDEEEALASLEQEARQLSLKLRAACNERNARLLEEGMEVAICGLPNVGKSSLFNALLSEERAIVTDIPGTTRDIVQGAMLLSGLRINLSDTAGLRDSEETVEKIGIERAKGMMRQADLLLVVLDGSRPINREEHVLLKQTEGSARLVLQSKSDLNQVPHLPETILFSSKTGDGLSLLKEKITAFAGMPAEGNLTLHRHMLLASNAADALHAAALAAQNQEPLDLCAVELHEALRQLGRITGDQVDEKLLDTVFSRFCVGK